MIIFVRQAAEATSVLILSIKGETKMTRILKEMGSDQSRMDKGPPSKIAVKTVVCLRTFPALDGKLHHLSKLMWFIGEIFTHFKFPVDCFRYIVASKRVA